MLFKAKSYPKFLGQSKNEHAVHSPFVFNLLVKCLYDKKNKEEYKIWTAYRSDLLNNHTRIAVKDFGAGSKVFRSNHRSISDIAKKAGISPKRAKLLFRLSHYLKPSNILEIGSSLGLSTTALSLGNPLAHITTIEGCPNTLAQCKVQLEKFNLHNVDCINSEFSAYLQAVAKQPKSFDMIYFDGNHSKKATLEYFEMLLPTVNNNSLWIFDDIYWSKEMAEAWKTILKHPKVTVSIDTFQWGLVFFRYEQPKQHFVIRT